MVEWQTDTYTRAFLRFCLRQRTSTRSMWTRTRKSGRKRFLRISSMQSTLTRGEDESSWGKSAWKSGASRDSRESSVEEEQVIRCFAIRNETYVWFGGTVGENNHYSIPKNAAFIKYRIAEHTESASFFSKFIGITFDLHVRIWTFSVTISQGAI